MKKSTHSIHYKKSVDDLLRDYRKFDAEWDSIESELESFYENKDDADDQKALRKIQSGINMRERRQNRIDQIRYKILDKIAVRLHDAGVRAGLLNYAFEKIEWKP